MIMMGLKFMGDVPFREVSIHALVRDAEGQKMSKSRGNIIDPLLMIDRYGTDALRFTLASMSSPGRDIKLSEERIEGYRNFSNKIWNAARFIIMNLEGTPHLDPALLSLPDRWILSRLNKTVTEVTGMLSEYRFDMAAHSIYRFFWHEFCDWYVELAKLQIAEGGRERNHTLGVLTKTLDVALRLLHPFMPFITEEIWQHIHYIRPSSIMKSPYPSVEDSFVDEGAEKEMDSVMDIIKGVRSVRSELNIPPGQDVDAYIKVYDEGPIGLTRLIEDHTQYIKRLAWVGTMVIGREIKRPEMSALSVISGGEIYLPLKGLIDIEKESGVLQKRLKGINDEIVRVQNKLANKAFLERAPDEVVLKEKEKNKELMGQKEKIENNLLWLKK